MDIYDENINGESLKMFLKCHLSVYPSSYLVVVVHFTPIIHVKKILLIFYFNIKRWISVLQSLRWPQQIESTIVFFELKKKKRK